MLSSPVVPVEVSVAASVVSVSSEVELDELADPEPVLAPEPEVSSGLRVVSTDAVEPEVTIDGRVEDEVEPAAVVDDPPSPSPGLGSEHAVSKQPQSKTRERMPDAIASSLADSPSRRSRLVSLRRQRPHLGKA